MFLKKFRSLRQTHKPKLGTVLNQNIESAINTSDTTSNNIQKSSHDPGKVYFSVSCLSVGFLAAGLIIPPLRLLTIPTQIYTMYPFIRSGLRDIIYNRRATMSVIDMIVFPVGLATGFLMANATAILLIHMSQLILKKTEDTSKQSIVDLFGELPNTVYMLMDGQEVEIPLEKLSIGDKIVVDAGNMIPVDGIIIDGLCSVDQRTLTGESQPIEKEVGDFVLAATMLVAGRIVVEVQNAGTETTAAQIGNILMSTADFKTNVQSRGEAVGDQTAPWTLVLAGATMPFMGLESAMAILFSSFGYNMRFVAPLSMLNYLGIALKSGILVKDARSFDSFKKVDTVIFDKTGTLTMDQPHIGQIYTWNGIDENTLLTYAAAAEHKQIHPIALAIIAESKQRNLALPNIENARYEVGYGITVTLQGHRVDNGMNYSDSNTDITQPSHPSSRLVHVGSLRFMNLEEIDVPKKVYTLQEKCQQKGYSLIMVAIDRQFCGVIELVPTIRPEVANIIKQLHTRGLTLYVISGDQEYPTRMLAESLDIDHYFANTLPEQKASHIERLQAEGRTVCFIGDGINDAIALKQADVSISLSGASTIATDTAQIILMDGSLKQVNKLFEIADGFEHNMNRNLWSTIVPGVICVGGVYLLNISLITSIAIFNAGLLAAVFNSMLPRLQLIGQRKQIANE